MEPEYRPLPLTTSVNFSIDPTWGRLGGIYTPLRPLSSHSAMISRSKTGDSKQVDDFQNITWIRVIETTWNFPVYKTSNLRYLALQPLHSWSSKWSYFGLGLKYPLEVFSISCIKRMSLSLTWAYLSSCNLVRDSFAFPQFSHQLWQQGRLWHRKQPW